MAQTGGGPSGPGGLMASSASVVNPAGTAASDAPLPLSPRNNEQEGVASG